MVDNTCEQRKLYQLNNIPPIRYTPSNPYPKFTQDQLNMRRKVEILKYKKGATKGSQLTKAEKYAQLTNPNYKVSKVVCEADHKIPVSSRSSGIPGPTIYLVEDKAVVLYNYAKDTNAYGELVFEDDEQWILNIINNQLIISGQNHTKFATLIIRPPIKNPFTNYTLKTPVIFRIKGTGINSNTNGSNINIKIDPINSTNNNSFQVTYNGNSIASNINSTTTFLQNNSVSFDLNNAINSTTYNYYCEAYVGFIEFSNILLSTSSGFSYDFNFNYIISHTIKDINGDIISANIQDYVTDFELYINVNDSYVIQSPVNCNINALDNTNLPDKKILLYTN